jgi:uncharacterized protein (UPF0333 family)
MMALAQSRQQPPLQRRNPRGQSLMEFVLVMPLLVLIFLGGFTFGMGMYEAHMASDAIQLPALKKQDMAKKAQAISSGELLGYVSSGGTTGTMKSGTLLDGINKQNMDNYTSIIVGTKSFVPLVNFLPGFTISTAGAINRSLLETANSGGATVRPANTAWVPGNTPQMPPWL